MRWQILFAILFCVSAQAKKPKCYYISCEHFTTGIGGTNICIKNPTFVQVAKACGVTKFTYGYDKQHKPHVIENCHRPDNTTNDDLIVCFDGKNNAYMWNGKEWQAAQKDTCPSPLQLIEPLCGFHL